MCQITSYSHHSLTFCLVWTSSAMLVSRMKSVVDFHSVHELSWFRSSSVKQQQLSVSKMKTERILMHHRRAPTHVHCSQIPNEPPHSYRSSDDHSRSLRLKKRIITIKSLTMTKKCHYSQSKRSQLSFSVLFSNGENPPNELFESFSCCIHKTEKLSVAVSTEPELQIASSCWDDVLEDGDSSWCDPFEWPFVEAESGENWG